MKKPASASTLSLLFVVAAPFAMAACGADGASSEPGPSDASIDAAATNGAPDASSTTDPTPPGGGSSSGQILSFAVDGAPVVVDFSRWGTPSYYQKTSAGWTLAVVANELGGQSRYFSLMVRGSGGAELSPGTYDCSTTADPATMAKGQIKYVEESFARTWEQAAGLPCSITIAEIGPVGGRMKGSFQAMLKATKGTTSTIAVTAGTFDITRKQYGSNAP